MQILLVCEQANNADGWSRYTKNLYDELKNHNHEVHICCNVAKEDINCYKILKKPINYLTNPFIPFVSSLKFKKIIKKIQPDIIHITVEPYAMMIPYLNKNIISKTILTIHGSYGVRPLENHLTRRNAKRYYQLIPKFITVSNFTKNVVANLLNNSEHFVNNTHVILNGIKIPALKRKIRSNKKKHIILVGEIKPRKGVLEAISACAYYKKIFNNHFSFSIVGSLNERNLYVKDVKEKIVDLNLEKEIKLLGRISEIELHKLYMKADLFLLPSITTHNTFEGFGLVFLEANSYGVPCIGTNTSGVAEAIKEGISGYKINPKNPKQIAERMDWVLNKKKIDPKACRRWAQKHDIKKAVKKIEKIYQSII